MELLIIRHALPIRRELDSGAADPELSEAGHEQAAHLSRYLADERIDALYSSPLARARETAAPLAAAKNLDVVTSPGIAEWDQNSPEYVPVEELKASNDPRWQAMLTSLASTASLAGSSTRTTPRSTGSPPRRAANAR